MKKSFGPKTLIYREPVWFVGTYDAGDRLDQLIIANACKNDPCHSVQCL